LDRLVKAKERNAKETPETIVRHFADEFLKKNETFYPVLRLILSGEVGEHYARLLGSRVLRTMTKGLLPPRFASDQEMPWAVDIMWAEDGEVNFSVLIVHTAPRTRSAFTT
jgi:hypothetical protein